LAEEGETDTDPLLGVKAPKLDSKVTEPLTNDEIRAMLKTCKGRDLRERRDEALIRFMVETGTRAGEVVALELPTSTWPPPRGSARLIVWACLSLA
jgi:integrase/recombinase XerD